MNSQSKTSSRTLSLKQATSSVSSPTTMATAIPVISIIIIIIIITSLLTPSLSLLSNQSVYDILPNFGLPRGLLPDSVADYSFSADDGHFLVHLTNPCYVDFDYLVFYDTTITGKLSYGSITDLKGIPKFVNDVTSKHPDLDCVFLNSGIQRHVNWKEPENVDLDMLETEFTTNVSKPSSRHSPSHKQLTPRSISPTCI